MPTAKGCLAGFVCLLASASFAGFGSTETYLPSVGRIPGKFGAQFYSTVWATNLTSAPQTFTFQFLKAGQSNPSPPSFEDTLQPGQTKVYENVVETKLSLTNVLGAARITSSGEIFFAERIYNQEPGDDLGKTEGLFFAGVPKSFSISAGQSATTAVPLSISGNVPAATLMNVTNLAVSKGGAAIVGNGDVGVAGIAQAGGGDGIGVLGQGAGDGAGIYGTTNQSGQGVFGIASGPGAIGVEGDSDSGIGVLGQAHGIGGAGVQGSNGATGTTGSLGDALSGVSGSAGSGGFGVMGTSTGQGGAGVQGTKSGTGNLGSLGTSDAAVEGLSTNATVIIGTTDGPTAAGVKGKNNDSGTAGYLAGENYGVLGTSSNSNAVIGQTSAHTAAGVEGDNTNTGTKGYLGGENYGVYAFGGFAGTGGKYFVEPHPTDPSKEIRYVCLEGRESGTYFRGTAHIVGGFATIEVPEDFRMVTAGKGLTVVATPVGSLAVLAAVRIGLDQIVVQGSSDVEFSYMVNGIRKALERHEPVSENLDFVPKSADDVKSWKALPAESVRRLIANGTLNADGTINLDTAHRLGWDKQESWKKAEERRAAGN